MAWKIFQKKANAEQAPRAAIVCCNPSWSPYVVTTERDFVTILVIFEEQQFLLTSVYSPPTEGLTDVTCNFIRVKQKCPTVPHVVGGDFNAHNIIWGYQDTTPKGRDMEDFMACHDLHLHNSQGAQPTYDNTYHKGWPDLTLSTANFANNFSSWDVLDDESNSDHRYIHFTLTLEASINILQRFKLPGGKIRRLKNAFQELLIREEDILEELTNPQELDDYTDHILSLLRQICQQILPTRTAKKLQGISWWTGRLREMKQRCRALRRRLRSATNEIVASNILTAFRQERAAYKKAILEAKINSWRSFCTSNSNPYGILHKLATQKIFQPAQVPVQTNSTTYYGRSGLHRQGTFKCYLSHR
ncbi:uncharacterized protein LOC118201988 [Stegodyphus dumicola]|uniref:uncharacterized protein LOC118201988 n=1 Tax=Stegodyphus dumicola TaxID=202533 RepID=UPI0015B172C2|nr:uncharacterized protein LOC118201988 [Stegodyphus dumicola]